MLTSSKSTVEGINVKAVYGLSSKSPVLYGTTTDGVFADFIESAPRDYPPEGSTVIRRLSGVQASLFREMTLLGYHPFEALRAVLDLKKPGVGNFKDLRELEIWLRDIKVSKREEEETAYWSALMRCSETVKFSDRFEDPFNHPLWEERGNSAYYWN